jgi:hypothetical protein
MPSPHGHLVPCLAVLWTFHPGPITRPLPPPRTPQVILTSLPPEPPRARLLGPVVQTPQAPPREAPRKAFSTGFRF